MFHRTLGFVSAVALLLALIGAPPAVARSPQPISDDQLKALSTTVGGAKVLPTDRTIPHWFGQTVDPSNGVTYGYNMAGADPNICTGTACDVTVEADITPIIVNIDGRTYNGNNVLAATLASPQFALNNYGSTPFATAAGAFPAIPGETRGPGGVLSQGDAGIQLQLQDATMRAQFNKTGASTYDLRLHPNVKPSVTINVPNNQGLLRLTDRGDIFASVSYSWWGSQIKNLTGKADPTHLPIYLTDDVLLHLGALCCGIGFHGAQSNAKSQGNPSVQTFAWATYLSPGIYAFPDGGDSWAVQDMHIVSHEVAEWADDPFINNLVEPWLTPTAPQYGCTNLLETGDPVVGIGFAMGADTFRQGPNPNGTQSADGYYHPEDEVFLPWFMRTAPNTVSEPTQTASANVGRYSLMGDLNPFPEIRQPATGC
jgi:hypothetical protein